MDEKSEKTGKKHTHKKGKHLFSSKTTRNNVLLTAYQETNGNFPLR